MTHRTLALFAMVIFVGMFVSTTARGADDVDSPRYAAWSKFKPGSSSTLSSDITAGPNTVHIDMTSTLVSVADDQIEIESVSKVEAMGHTNNPTPVKRTIKSKVPAQDVKENGTQDVKAMDKTFTCKVLELSGNSASDAAPRNGDRPAPKDVKVVLYINGDVPGGLVKIEMTPTNGQTMTFLLSAMEVK
jgi:hypothetical protein